MTLADHDPFELFITATRSAYTASRGLSGDVCWCGSRPAIMLGQLQNKRACGRCCCIEGESESTAINILHKDGPSGRC